MLGKAEFSKRRSSFHGSPDQWYWKDAASTDWIGPFESEAQAVYNNIFSRLGHLLSDVEVKSPKGGYGNCKDCGRKILWMRNERGKNRPCDPLLLEASSLPLECSVISEFGFEYRNSVDATKAPGHGFYVIHFNTCPSRPATPAQGSEAKSE